MSLLFLFVIFFISNQINHVISGIMAGNAVVGKVSEHASWSASYYGKIIRTALEVHGHNPDLVATITGVAEAGQALVQDPLVDKIIFTGSTPIGRKVMQSASKHLTPVILELGGKDAMVFRHDVSLKEVIPWVMRGCFQNAGQNCVGVERVLVYESIHDDFIKQVVPKVKAIRQGIPLKVCGADGKVDCGSLIMPNQMDIVQTLVDDAVKKGATLHCGGKKNPTVDGQFFQPTVLRYVYETITMNPLGRLPIFYTCHVLIPNFFFFFPSLHRHLASSLSTVASQRKWTFSIKRPLVPS